MEFLKRYLLYGGKEKKQFLEVRPLLIENNRKNLCNYTLLAIAGMIIMLACSLVADSLVKNRATYTVTALVSAALYALARWPAKKSEKLTLFCEYMFLGLFFAFGIMLGTFIEPNECTVSFVVMLFAVPLLFADVPLYMVSAILLSMVAYFICAYITQNPVMLGYNASNVMPYGILSMVVSTYMMSIKTERYVLEQENRLLSETDQLTGLLNRRSFEQHLEILSKNTDIKSVMFCAMDINGLKKVNDSLGHQAGDELIRGAADCIEGTFGQYGRCYRVGGDEFMAILQGPRPSERELKEMLDNRTECWKGHLVSGLSIAVGIMTFGRDVAPADMLKMADATMYNNKAEYYRQSGNDRRQ